MDELVERIISIINQREHNTLFLSCRTPSQINQGIKGFLYNKQIHLSEVDVLFLERFIKKDSDDPLVRWLYQSYNYDCHLTFELAFSNTDLIPNELFNECSVTLLNNQGKQYFQFPKKSDYLPTSSDADAGGYAAFGIQSTHYRFGEGAIAGKESHCCRKEFTLC